MKLIDAINDSTFMNHLDNLNYMELLTMIDTEDIVNLIDFLCEENCDKGLIAFLNNLDVKGIAINHTGRLECELGSGMQKIKQAFQIILTLLMCDEDFGYDTILSDFKLNELPEDLLPHYQIETIYLTSGYDELDSVIHSLDIQFVGSASTMGFTFDDTFDYDDSN